MIKFTQLEENNWIFETTNIPQDIHDEFDHAMYLWEEGEFDNVEVLLRYIIVKSPLHVDAIYHLSVLFDMSARNFEAFLACREAVSIALEALPESFNWKTATLEWGLLENRPFLRAYHSLGLWYKRRGDIDSAILVFTRLLSVCPNDNLGVRYIIPSLWLEKGDILSIIRHCKMLPDVVEGELLYTYSLALILANESSKARESLKEARKQLPLIAKELLKKNHRRPKAKLPGYISFGGADHAFEYWEEYGKFWKNSKLAMDLLAEK